MSGLDLFLENRKPQTTLLYANITIYYISTFPIYISKIKIASSIIPIQRSLKLKVMISAAITIQLVADYSDPS